MIWMCGRSCYGRWLLTRGGGTWRLDCNAKSDVQTENSKACVISKRPFLESPGNFSGPKTNFQIEIQRIRARVLANKLLHFVSLTDSFIMLDAKLLKPLSCM